ncbi:hypothetical protein F4554_004387 [Actinopolymorpha rutila]|uniref:Uncharacterized protein n=1 Tax=Actinopolymorpha rutila TaxID=446787 RepID=A0A852ZQQ5_9ACTN|nr:hypothetical protein [Actinopolymorpha rutila]
MGDVVSWVASWAVLSYGDIESAAVWLRGLIDKQ